jgi:hypothetical protein
MVDELDIRDFDLKNNLKKLSVRYNKNPKFEMNPSILNEYNSFLSNKNHKIRPAKSKAKLNLIINDGEDDNYIALVDIKNKESLDKAVKIMLNSLASNEYEIRETHEYAQVLPEKFYAPGSHLENRRVAFALKKTDDRLFLSWILLRSKASDFDYNTIPELHAQWKKYFNISKEGVTRRSIMYWAKQYNYDGYQKVKDASIDNAIEELNKIKEDGKSNIFNTSNPQIVKEIIKEFINITNIFMVEVGSFL